MLSDFCRTPFPVGCWDGGSWALWRPTSLVPLRVPDVPHQQGHVGGESQGGDRNRCSGRPRTVCIYLYAGEKETEQGRNKNPVLWGCVLPEWTHLRCCSPLCRALGSVLDLHLHPRHHIANGKCCDRQVGLCHTKHHSTGLRTQNDTKAKESLTSG